MTKPAHRRPGRQAVLAAVVLLALSARPAGAASRIVNGVDSQDYPTTGALLRSSSGAINSDNAGVQCSGTLIGCRTFLTAAHCVRSDTNASHYQVYLQHAGLLAVSSIAYHPSYTSGLGAHDIAVVHLAADVTGIDPTTFNSSHDLVALGVGLPGTIAGFGETAGGANDYGIKRAGNVVTADCNLTATGGEDNDVLVCFDYEAPVGAPGEDSDTCYGDSGGPLFVDFGDGPEVVGATTSGSSDTCQAPDHAWNVSVFANAAWVAAELGSDSTAACGDLPPVGDAAAIVQKNAAPLSLISAVETFTVTVPSGQALVRLTLNGTDNNSFNPDFYVKQGIGADPSDFDCKADGNSVFGACDFANPAAGTWSVYVKRVAGSGQFQVTTTMFASPSPTCGNNVTDGGENCDGSDDAACPGLCSDTCTCASPCSSGALQERTFLATGERFSYRALLLDSNGDYDALDPRNEDFRLQVTGESGEMQAAIPAGDTGWVRADTLRRRYVWKGDGSIDGLTRARLAYRSGKLTSYWTMKLRGRTTETSTLVDTAGPLEFHLDFDGTCHEETK